LDESDSYPPRRTKAQVIFPLLSNPLIIERFFMEEFVVYILFSEKHHKSYVGFTSNLIERFKSHNELSKNGFTKNYRPWMVIHVEFFNCKSLALKREKYLKTGVGREFIKTIISELN